MGLFSFLKNAGSKIFTKEEEAAAENAEVSTAEMDAQRLKRLQFILDDIELPTDELSVELDHDKVTVYGQTESQSVKEKVVLALGNVNGVASVDDRISVVTPAPQATFYEVKGGDSLSKIAKREYGNAMKYMVIFEANRPMLKDPNLIYPGQVLRIPPADEFA